MRDAAQTAAGAARHVLWTVLGTRAESTEYVLGDKTVRARLAPLALCALRPGEQDFSKVVALTTAAAREQTLPVLEDGLSEAGIALETLDILDGASPEDLDTFLRDLTKAAAPGAFDLSVDLTHGPRHFAVLLYTAAHYLVALRGVRVRGVHYGLFGAKGSPSPILDLKPLLDLSRWAQAVDTLRGTGSTRPLAHLVGEQVRSGQQVANKLDEIATAHLSGLPLELGHATHGLLNQTKSLAKKLRGQGLPLANELVETLTGTLEPVKLVSAASGSGWKGAIDLTDAELARQARFIDTLIAQDHLAAALGAMSEWTISWAVGQLGDADTWLNHHVTRLRASRALATLAALASGTESDLADACAAEQKTLGKFWGQLSDLRNGLHHHGMRRQVLLDKGNKRAIADVLAYWGSTLKSNPAFSLELPTAQGNALLTSLGRRPGVLASALAACRKRGFKITNLLVVCSRQTEVLVAEATREFEYTGKTTTLVIEDPVGGDNEIVGLATQAGPHLVCAEALCVNLTGGTAVMGLAVAAITDRAARLSRTIHRFGLIDRRAPGEQDREPYVRAESFWLEDTENHGHR